MKLMETRPVIAIITDFGHDDPFVGIMKGVISKLSPRAQLIDISNSIPQGDIQRGAIQLWMAKSFFPAGTVFLAVVDPGVGTERKAMIIEDGDFTYVGPNNGLFSYAVEGKFHAWELSNPEYQLAYGSSTFHGRDIFAPAAAQAANGIPGMNFGNQIGEIVQIPMPDLVVAPERMSGEIIYADRFGNLLTSLGKFIKSGGEQYRFEPWLPLATDFSYQLEYQIGTVKVQLPDGQLINWVQTFANIPPMECGILVGSTGLLEIAAFNASAQTITNLSVGDPVALLF